MNGDVVHVTSDGTRPGTRVELDGQLLRGVHRVSVTLDINDQPDVVIWLNRSRLDVTVPADKVRVFDTTNKKETS